MDASRLIRGTRKFLKRTRCGAVIVAAGNAARIGGIDKVTVPLGGVPVLLRAVQAFSDSNMIDEIVIVTRRELIPQVNSLCGAVPKVTAVVAGGKTRTESVSLGLNALSDQVTHCAIHDGARPLVSEQVIARTVQSAMTCGAAAPAIPVKDTVKVAHGDVVRKTPNRDDLYAVQTPQVFDFDILRGALKKAAEDHITVTDDCSAVEHMGFKVKLVTGEERNIKITTPLDLKIAEVFLEDKT